MMMTKAQIINVIELRPLLDQLHPNIFRENLYHDCDEEDNELGRMNWANYCWAKNHCALY